jgi:spermidine synthase
MRIDPILIAEESATAGEFERRVLSELERSVGCDVAFFSLAGAEAAPTVLGLEQSLIARAVAGGADYARELSPVKRAAVARRGVAVDTAVLGWQHVQRSKYYREVAARVGGRHSLLACLSWQKRPRGMIMLGRAGREFSHAEIERVEDALPAIAVARAAFGLPVPCPPLPTNAGLFARLAGRRERVLAELETASGTLTVRDRHGYREMVAGSKQGELVWSRARLDDPSVSGWPYLELFHVAATRAERRERALFVGCGGAVVVRRFARVYPGLTSDVVECEPAVLELARRFFDLDAIPGVCVHLADGADFVARAARETWDIVVVDAYGASEMDGAFSTRAFFADVRRALRPGGTLALNVIGALAAGGAVERVVSAMQRELTDVRILPVAELRDRLAGDALRNVVVVGGRGRE